MARSTQNLGGRFKASVIHKPEQLIKAKETAQARLDILVEKIENIQQINEKECQIFFNGEPFVAEQFNESFIRGKRCPGCGCRQTWYPAASGRPSIFQRAAAYSIVAALFFSMAFYFLDIIVSDKYFFLQNPIVFGGIVGLIFGIVTGILSVVIPEYKIKKYYHSSPAHNLPVILWGESKIRLLGSDEKKTDEAIDGSAEKIFFMRRVNVDIDRATDPVWKILPGLRHENIAEIRSASYDGFGIVTLEAEKIEGSRFGDIIRKGMSESRFQDHMMQLLDAVEYLHLHEPAITHNKIRLDTIRIKKSDELKLTDFEKVRLDFDVKLDISMIGAVMGAVNGKFMKNYQGVVFKCKLNMYESISELREDFYALF